MLCELSLSLCSLHAINQSTTQRVMKKKTSKQYVSSANKWRTNSSSHRLKVVVYDVDIIGGARQPLVIYKHIRDSLAHQHVSLSAFKRMLNQSVSPLGLGVWLAILF